MFNIHRGASRWEYEVTYLRSSRNVVLSLGVAFLALAVDISLPRPSHAAHMSQCDPNAAIDDEAYRMRNSGDYTRALQSLSPVVAKPDAPFRSLYIAGTILMLHGGKPNLQRGLVYLLRAETQLASLTTSCIGKYGSYSIYNTIGVAQYRLGNKAEALRYYLLAYGHIKDQTSWTKRDLLNNLGQWYFIAGDLKQAARYYGEARASGDDIAAVRLKTIDELVPRGSSTG